jgi:hypothetical protein
MRSYTQLTTDYGILSLNNSPANIVQGTRLINDAIRILVNKFYFNESSFTTPSVSGQQFYNLPPQCRKIINVTGTIGSVVWITKDCPDRNYWDFLNTIQFKQDFPMFHFIWNHNTQFGVWPTPASSGNTYTVNYQARNIDLSQPDYTTGTVTATNASPTLTFAGSTLVGNMANRWIQISAPAGDNQWYQILSVNTGANTAVLYGNYTGTSVSGASFVIGEMAVLPEDYQDLPLYRALEIYFTSIVSNATKAKLYQGLYERGYEQLNGDYGSKTTGVVLTDTDAELVNPNLFQNNVHQA